MQHFTRLTLNVAPRVRAWQRTMGKLSSLRAIAMRIVAMLQRAQKNASQATGIRQ
jgi:hypothetical protein